MWEMTPATQSSRHCPAGLRPRASPTTAIATDPKIFIPLFSTLCFVQSVDRKTSCNSAEYLSRNPAPYVQGWIENQVGSLKQARKITARASLQGPPRDR